MENQKNISQTAPPPLFLKVFLNVFLAMTGAYGLSLVLFLLGRYIIGERFVVIAFYNTFAHLLLIPAIFLLPIMLLLRKWQIAVMLTPAVVFVLWIYGANFIPRNPEIPDDVQVISIQSHNILAGNHDTETIVSIIQGFDADIVVMQEVTHLMAAAFESRLSEDYPYQALHPQNIGVQGMAVLSRYPILEDTYWKYEWVPTPLAHQRSVLQITETDSIVLYNSHPTHPGMNYSTFNPSWRSREIADVLERTFREELPVLLVGDFNLPDLSEDYQHVTENYTDAFRESGYGMGWTFGMIPNNPPFLRLDYIFITDDFTPISSRVGDSAGGSDHYPLFAEIGLISSNNP